MALPAHRGLRSQLPTNPEARCGDTCQVAIVATTCLGETRIGEESDVEWGRGRSAVLCVFDHPGRDLRPRTKSKFREDMFYMTLSGAR